MGSKHSFSSRFLAFLALLAVAAVLYATSALSQGLAALRQKALAEPFVGVTTDGTPTPGLFAIRSTGVSTEPVARAAEAFLASLTDEQKSKTCYPADDIEWRKWDNVHRAPREGVRLGDMSDSQRERAFELFRASLSATGLQKTRNVMHLNEHLAELVGNHEEYGEGLYYVSLMGEPSLSEPWGWQLDRHHLVLNYFVLGDQVVMTPAFCAL